jgi:hypothetical protein
VAQLQFPHSAKVDSAGNVYIADFGNQVIRQLAGLRFIPVTPCRVAATRLPTGPFGAPFLTGGTTRSFAIPNSSCGIPSTAQAYQ